MSQAGEDDEGGEQLGDGFGEPEACASHPSWEQGEGGYHKDDTTQQGEQGRGVAALHPLQVAYGAEVYSHKDETNREERQPLRRECVGRTVGSDEDADDGYTI